MIINYVKENHSHSSNLSVSSFILELFSLILAKSGKVESCAKPQRIVKVAASLGPRPLKVHVPGPSQRLAAFPVSVPTFVRTCEMC